MENAPLFIFSIPGLRPRDVDPQNTPMLYQWANAGASAELIPTFPCVTSPVQASMWTGATPDQHGVIANGFYDRDQRTVDFWTGWNEVIDGEQVWDSLRRVRPDATSAVWHGQNIKGASCDYIVTPAPIHEPDGRMKLWCYSQPEPLYAQLLVQLGHFPLQHYWGPMAGIQSTQWILDAARWLAARHSPQWHWIYIPHLDYAGQKFGPNSPQAHAALQDMDAALGRFAEKCNSIPTSRDATFLAVGEYAMTEVTGVIFPNRILREAGALQCGIVEGCEEVDMQRSPAFAMVDHQFAHVFVNAESEAERRRRIAQVVAIFSNCPGVAAVYEGTSRAAVGMGHPRAGDVVLVCDDAHWMAYYWWFDDAAAPAFARTVDIHRKPGYDPVELFFDPATKGIPLNAAQVKGSHGVPATAAHHRTAMICSKPGPSIESGQTYRDVEMKRIWLELLGVG